MKKWICLILAASLALLLLGCRRKDKTPPATDHNPTTATGQQNNDPADEKVDLIAVSVPAVTEDTAADDGTVVFQYTYQHMSLVLDKPDVADKIILDFLNRVDSTKESATTTATSAKTAYDGNKNWTPYLYHVTYSPMRIDHKVLSLFGNNVVYTGATHPERTCVSASYDLQTGDILTLASIMNKDATVQQFCDLVLEGLAEMAEGDYLYENYKDTVKHRFEADPAHDENWYFTQTGLCFYFAPYEIAPYASGVITVEIPFEKLTKLVHEAYQPEVRGPATGKITVAPFENPDMNNNKDIAEIVVNNTGAMYMLQADTSVQDIRIMLNDKASNYTVFAAYGLSSGDGIMVQADSEILPKMKLTYKSSGETVSANIG